MSVTDYEEWLPAYDHKGALIRIKELQAKLADKEKTLRTVQESNRILRLDRDVAKELQEQVAELAKDRAFFRSCALSGEIPECGSEPSALEQKP